MIHYMKAVITSPVTPPQINECLYARHYVSLMLSDIISVMYLWIISEDIIHEPLALFV